MSIYVKYMSFYVKTCLKLAFSDGKNTFLKKKFKRIYKKYSSLSCLKKPDIRFLMRFLKINLPNYGYILLL